MIRRSAHPLGRLACPTCGQYTAAALIILVAGMLVTPADATHTLSFRGRLAAHLCKDVLCERRISNIWTQAPLAPALPLLDWGPPHG